MKENIERIVREQLESYELPYENGAWEQFAKRLDGTPSTPFYRKWWFAASLGTVLVGSATYFALTSSDAKENKTTPNKDQVAVISGTSDVNHTSNSQPRSNNSETSSVISNTETNTIVSMPDIIVHRDLQDQSHATHPIDGQNTLLNQVDLIIEPIVTNPKRFVKLVLPVSVCINESFSIENPNDEVVTVTLPNGRTKLIQAKQTAEIKSPKSGDLKVETSRSTESIIVNEPATSLYINRVEANLLYENGVPTLKFDVSGSDQSISWDSNIAASYTEKGRLIVHPYTEREVKVTANSTDANGCPVSENQIVTMYEPYNLMAPTGFNPSSNDNRNSQFIPYALTIRDTPFEMVVMDPNNMAILFKTSDASQGWNGIDSRTGQLVPMGSTWLWKVVMKKPLSGEPTEYKGLITSKGM